MKNNFSLAGICLFLCVASGQAQDLIPRPARMETAEGEFVLSPATVITYINFPDLVAYLNRHIEQGYGKPLAINFLPENAPQRISIGRDPALPAESYLLQITPREIKIRGGNRGGAFYAIQTLLQLMDPAVYTSGSGDRSLPPRPIPCLTVEDAPRYAYRGVMLDVSRTFFDKATVMRYIDWMSRHKINKLHWHLNDDEGWRVEIKAYPDLTEKGAWRGPGEAIPVMYGSGERRYGGYYTQEEIREIVRYAAFRNIEIIPEIDLPGHGRAVRGSYPEIFCETPGGPPASTLYRNVWCAGREENYEMIGAILREFARIFPSKRIHVGGDEVNVRYWKECPRCQAVMESEGITEPADLQGYFMQRVEKIAHGLGKTCGAWNEVIRTGGMDSTTLIYGWESADACRETLSEGYPLVVMPAQWAYIDMKQSPFDKGHTWAWMVDTRRVYSLEPSQLAAPPAAEKQIQGVEVAQWAELLGEPERFVEYQGYPRICALAEVGWSRREHRDWEDFYRRLVTGHFPRLAAMGIAFRVFPPEVRYEGGRISASTDVPGAEIEYTTGHDPARAIYTLYRLPIATSRPERYLFRTTLPVAAPKVTMPRPAAGNLPYPDSTPAEGVLLAGQEESLWYSPAVPAMALQQVVTLSPHERRDIQFKLDHYIHRNGVWYLSVIPELENTMINRLEIKGADTVFQIIRNGQVANPSGNIRIEADERSRTATATLVLTNGNAAANRVAIGLRPSPFLEPETTVSSSMDFTRRFPADNMTDYNLLSYARSTRPPHSGDYVLFTFAEALECGSIEVITGAPNLLRYYTAQATAEYSADGVAFSRGGSLDDSGRLIFYPKHTVKALRIRIHAPNGESFVGIQDLRIRAK